MFLILGWEVAKEENKCKAFALSLTMLGIILDASGLLNGDIFVRNKEDRVEDLCTDIDSIIATGRCLRPLAANMRGKLQYASNQIFGRQALSTLAALSQHQFRSRSPFISVELREELVRFRVLLCSERPRHLALLGETRPIFVFSDGACEGEHFQNVTVGSILMDPADGTKEMFGVKVPEEVVSFWQSDRVGKEQTIGQAELLPAVLSRLIWRKKMMHRRIIFCLDNDSARACLIKGTSASSTSRILIGAMILAEVDFQSWTWYCRVPTASNPGDYPSRLKLDPCAENLFAKCISPPTAAAIVSLSTRGIFKDF